MSRLKGLIEELCPNGIEFKDLEKCCNILDNKRKPVTKSARIAGKYPYYGANGIQDYVFEYIFDGKYVLVGEDGSVINENGNPIVTWAEGKIWVNNHAHIIEEKEGVSLKYLYHYIQTINVTNLIHGNIPKLNQGDFRKLQIAVPPLEVQDEIVRILDDFTLLSAELSAELKARKKQYKYYRDKLLHNKESKINLIKLKDIAEIGTGSSNTNDGIENGKYPFYVRSQEPLSKNEYEFDETAIITAGDGVGVGKVFHYVTGKYALHQRAYRIHIINNNVNPKYCFYYFKARFNEYIKKTMVYSSVASIRKPMLENFEIPLISKDNQNKIVEVLDNFEKISTDLNIGLPAEIEARQKQYEFYRDTLLTYVATGEIILQDKTRQDKQ